MLRIVTAVLAIILTACSVAPATTPGATPAGSVAATDARATAPASAAASLAIPTVEPFASYDPGLVTELMAEGMSEGEAIFAVMTRADVEQLSALSYRIVESFPTGNSAEFTVTLTPDQAGDPDSPDILASYTDADGDFGFRLEYFIAYDDMPDDVEQEIRGAAAGAVAPVVLAGSARGLGPIAAQEAGVHVVAEGLVKKFIGNQTSNFLTFLEGKLGTGGALGNLYKSIKALLSVKDALAMQSEFEEIERQINELKDCAENPTNPVTRKAYSDDPGYKQRILDQVEATRTETKSNTAMMFLGLINSTGSSLVRVKWLGYVVGPATAWSKSTLQELNAKLLAELKNSITPCEGYQFVLSGTGSGTKDDLLGTPLHVTYSAWGLLCPESAEWKIWEIYESDHDYDAQTGPPEAAPLGPMLATFGPNGVMTRVTWPGLGMAFEGETGAGTSFSLSPPRGPPTSVTAVIPAGTSSFAVSVPVEKIDGSFGSCEGNS